MLKAHSTRNTKQFLVSVPPHLPFNIRDSSDSVTHLWPLDQMWAGFTLCESRWLVVWTHRSVCSIKGGSIALLRSFSPLEDCCSCSEKHLFRLYSPWLIHGLWLSSDAVREYTALCFPCTSCLSYRGGCLWWLWCPFSAPHKPPSNLHSLLFCMGTDWWCYRRAESDSTGMELQNTSWLGCHTAVRADSPTSSSWQRNTAWTTWNDTSSSSCGCLFPLLHRSLFSLFLFSSPFIISPLPPHLLIFALPPPRFSD